MLRPAQSYISRKQNFLQKKTSWGFLRNVLEGETNLERLEKKRLSNL